MHDGLVILGVIFAIILIGIIGNIGRFIAWMGFLAFEVFGWIASFIFKGILFLVMLWALLFVIVMIVSKL